MIMPFISHVVAMVVQPAVRSLRVFSLVRTLAHTSRITAHTSSPSVNPGPHKQDHCTHLIAHCSDV